ncbi:MAG: hypothetical protein GQ468_06285 [Candidatus Scalindua sp.]|nr:hypothetical protein [Candidatus Scalindua sp.]
MNSEIMRDARLVLQVLEKEWWVWEYSMEEEVVLFESENTVIEFNSAVERIGMLVLKIKVLQHAILKAQAGDSGWQIFNAKEF